MNILFDLRGIVVSVRELDDLLYRIYLSDAADSGSVALLLASLQLNAGLMVVIEYV